MRTVNPAGRYGTDFAKMLVNARFAIREQLVGSHLHITGITHSFTHRPQPNTHAHLQHVLAVVVRQQQVVEAGVRGGQPVAVRAWGRVG